MEKSKEITIEVRREEHLFYCDRCKKYLGTSYEYDDGWYLEIGEFELAYFVDGDWYKIKRHFCDDCKSSFLYDFKYYLNGMGFKKE